MQEYCNSIVGLDTVVLVGDGPRLRWRQLVRNPGAMNSFADFHERIA